MQVTENQVRSIGVTNIDEIAGALNGVARALGSVEPYVSATGTAPSRTFTVDEEIAQFIQARAARRPVQAGGTPAVERFGFDD